MTRRRALLLASGMHLALLAGLSLGLTNWMAPNDAEPDVTPVEFVEIAEAATATARPKPTLDAAPRDPAPPALAEDAPMPVAAPEVTPPVEKPAPAPDDTAPQDAIAEAVASAPARPRPPQKGKPAAQSGQNAALVDKSRPAAPAKPRDPSDFAKSIEAAIPKSAKISAIQAATLQQAIRAQIAPCWNPPIGGADVAEMTAVLRIRLNRDGTVAAPPEFVSQSGATAGNQAYSRAFVDTARRAVLRCAPLQLPDELFAYWREFELNFDPRLMT
ncbi:MAG: TonB C-terminal domain-containing protein [Sandaracinobacteroides sp.]